MNPLTNVKNVLKLSEQELRTNNKTSWHDEYRDSAWIFIGGLPYDLTEGDVICIFSQYGEIVNINFVRDKESGKPKGFCFLCYEDQRSTILAVDNLNGIKTLGRTIRVDHVKDYKPPKDSKKLDNETRNIIYEGCAPKLDIANESDSEIMSQKDKIVKDKKKKKKHKKKHKKHQRSSSSDSDDDKRKKHKKHQSSSSESDDYRRKKQKKKHKTEK